MSIFGSIMNKIFHHEAGTSSAGSSSSSSGTGTTAQQSASASMASNVAASSSQPAVDVESVLTGMEAKSGQQLDWRRSIVDLMKLLGLDSSIGARKELAQELHYSRDTNDSASMNVWLHKQVMQKLAENGGKVPDSLRA